MYDTHIVRRLRAYDEKGELLHPNAYFKKLRGATVEVRFTVSRYLIMGRGVNDKNREGFQTDVVRLDILTPPAKTVKMNLEGVTRDHHVGNLEGQTSAPNAGKTGISTSKVLCLLFDKVHSQGYTGGGQEQDVESAGKRKHREENHPESEDLSQGV